VSAIFLGFLFGRSVKVLAVSSLREELRQSRFDQVTTLFWLSSEQDLEHFRVCLVEIIQEAPLLVSVAGPRAEAAFDVLLQGLSVEPCDAHVMTRQGTDCLSESVAEFFQSAWPSEERIDDWRGYVLVAGQEHVLALSATVSDYLR
jgi:hypothetical protein